MRIGDITTINNDLAFRNDVKLSHYRRAENERLVKNYQFSAQSAEGDTSTVDLLGLLCNTVNDESENRFIFEATYGKGKSHFALALANFFGKPLDSAETETILRTIGHVSNDSRVGTFKDFKTYHRPFLTVLMDGVEPGSLRDKFFHAFDRALKDNAETAGETPPFWFGEALKFLNNLSAENVAKARQFLEPHNLEFEQLKESVEGGESQYYELCHELFQQVYGSRPNFGSETSLSDALEWASSSLCGDDGPLGGVLVLFDEFSLFVQSYGKRPGGELQDLLNGTEANRGKTLFVAFTQESPENGLGNDQSSGVQNLHKELNRIPKNNRLNLQSSLEDVLRGFFKEDNEKWYEFLGTPGISAQVSDASGAALAAFKTYYPRELGWDAERFQEAITKECFPLHPLTTVLLSRVPLKRASTTRSIIGYLNDANSEVTKKLKQDASVGGTVNWVLPISLVDYFADMLDEDIWSQYQSVKVPDMTKAQGDVLKAMVLQRVGELQTRNLGPQGFEIIIGQLAGLTPDESKKVLVELESGLYIREDKTNKTYSFYTGNNGALALDAQLNNQIEGLRNQNKLTTLTDTIVEHSTKATRVLDDVGLTEIYPVSVKWGSSDDWAAEEIFLTRAGFTKRNLEHLLESCQAVTGKFAKRRGVVIVLLAATQDDVSFFESEVESVLDSTELLKAAPFVALRPVSPEPELVRALLKFTVLSDTFFAAKASSDVGRQVFDEEKARIRDQVSKGLKKLRAEGLPVVPQDARGQVRTFTAGVPQNAKARLTAILGALYNITYHKAPESFFHHYNLQSRHLKNAVIDLVSVLENNNVANSLTALKALKNNGQAKVATETLEQFLMGSWGVVDSRQQLQVPSAPRIRTAWEFLEATFRQGETVPLSSALLPLLNAPFGYDFHTLTLLFSSWYGLNRRTLKVYVGSKIVTLDQLIKEGKGKTETILEKLNLARLYRQNEDKEKARVEKVIALVEAGGLSAAQAGDLMSELENYRAKHEDDQSRLMTDLNVALEKAQGALAAVGKYEGLALSIDKGVQRAKTVTDFGQQLREFEKLPPLFTVLSTFPPPEDIHKNLMTQTRTFVERQCETNERLSSGLNYGLHQNRLSELKKELGQFNLGGLVPRVDEAFERLDEAHKNLDVKGRIEAIRRIPERDVRLKILEAGKTEVSLHFQDGNEAVEAAAREKFANIEREAKRLRDFVVALPSEIDNVSSARTARDLSVRVARQQHSFEGTADYDDLESDLQRLRHLEEAFTELEKSVDLASAKEIAKRQETLRALESLGEQVQAKVAVKLNELDEQLARKNTALLEGLSKFYDARSSGDVMQGERSLGEFRAFFAGTDHEAEIDTALTKVATFRQFFGDLEGAERAPRRTLDDFAESRRALEALVGSYENQIGDAQVAAMRAQLSRLTGDLEQQVGAAEAWLRDLQSKAASALNVGQLNDLQRRLEAPPAFLPESLYNEAEALQDEIETKLDGLALADIEYRFKGLPGDQRAACLERLQRLMRELEAA